jgi:hypothetical protein
LALQVLNVWQARRECDGGGEGGCGACVQIGEKEAELQQLNQSMALSRRASEDHLAGSMSPHVSPFKTGMAAVAAMASPVQAMPHPGAAMHNPAMQRATERVLALQQLTAGGALSFKGVTTATTGAIDARGDASAGLGLGTPLQRPEWHRPTAHSPFTPQLGNPAAGIAPITNLKNAMVALRTARASKVRVWSASPPQLLCQHMALHSS